jgi:hypothetical protein
MRSAICQVWRDNIQESCQSAPPVTQTVGTLRAKQALEKTSKKVYLCCRNKQEMTYAHKSSEMG